MTTTIQQLGTIFKNAAYDSVFRWVLFIAAIILGVAVLWDYGFVNYLFESDSSRVSVLIIALFAGFSGYCLYILLLFAGEMRFVAAFAAQSIADTSGTPNDGAASRLPKSRVLAAFFADVRQKEIEDPGSDRALLLQSLTADFRKRTRVGVYAADLLYKLGMLGTVIGFVIMLNSMGDLSNFDVDTLRGALTQMTGGMAVALLTTIAGLVCGILLRVQFNIAESQASEILQVVVRVTEVSFIPEVKRNNTNA